MQDVVVIVPKTLSKREKNNFDHPDSFDFKLLYRDLSKLLSNKIIYIPTYSYKTHTRKKEVKECQDLYGKDHL